MTPFGERIRQLRDERGVSQAEMARALGVTAAYLSAMEHGHRSRPTWAMVQQIITYFDLIWDDADALHELAKLSHPRITVDTSGLHPEATEIANRISRRIDRLSADQLARISAILDET